MKHIVALLVFYCALGPLQAQFNRLDLPVLGLSNATAGGFNCPQPYNADLNFDGQPDMVVFDRVGDVWTPFLSDCSGETCVWTFAPGFKSKFPSVKAWSVLRDFNADGIQDIFAYSDVPGISGIQVWRGYNDNDTLSFERLYFANNNFGLLYYPIGEISSNIYVPETDIPAFDDLDNDGDMDLLSFTTAGGVIIHYRNRSQQLGFGADSLLFELAELCWGKFYEPGLIESVNLSGDPDTCADFDGFANNDLTPRHAGSTILTWDLNNDGDKEVMLGDISFSNINMLTNGGTPTQAYMTAQTSVFPANSVAVSIPVFPAPFKADIDFDGVPDFLSAPNAKFTAENSKVLWWYRNTGTEALPVFEFQSKTALIEDILDVGTHAYPAFADIDADGLVDMLLGNGFLFLPGGNKEVSLRFYKNTGTTTAPIFTLQDIDFGNMNQFSSQTFSFSPTFGDLDSDGDLDLLVGEEYGKLFFLENTAGADQPMVFAAPVAGYQQIDVGTNSMPQIADMNQDGLNDLVVGENNGNLNLLLNTGSVGNPVFNPASLETAPITNEFLGAVDTRVGAETTGASSPWVYKSNGNALRIYAGSRSGQLFQYDNVNGNIGAGQPFVVTNTNLNSFKEGIFLRPTFADLTGDGLLELVVGNMRGGISFFGTDISDGTTGTQDFRPTILRCSPNPTNSTLLLETNFSGTFEYSIYAPDGRLLHTKSGYGPQMPINVDYLATGLYFLQACFPNGACGVTRILKN